MPNTRSCIKLCIQLQEIFILLDMISSVSPLFVQNTRNHFCGRSRCHSCRVDMLLHFSGYIFLTAWIYKSFFFGAHDPFPEEKYSPCERKKKAVGWISGMRFYRIKWISNSWIMCHKYCHTHEQKGLILYFSKKKFFSCFFFICNYS